MKKNFIMAISICVALLLSGCVTKQKYNELQSQYKKCQDELTYVNSENVDFSNAKKQLTAQVESLTKESEQLKKDTLSLSRRLRQSERDLAKATKDYDDMLKDFTRLNAHNQNQMNDLMSNIDKYKDELDAKEKLLNAQQDSLNSAKADLAAKEARIQEMQDILNQKDAEVKALKDKVSAALKGFEGSGLNVYEKDGKVYVSMDDKLLFASGSWVINTQGMNAIRNLASVLENEKEIFVLIEGHTDNVPYHGNGQVKDNWDLSVMRATSVVKALLQNGNIEPVRLSASGRSEYLPIDSENTAEARAKNRRTEIILTPNLDQLFKLIQNN
ncbi:MAG: OmpA family protein [Bacteroidales bacterium]|nr:OmpA family protein [Bacteroidales bacterium]MBR0304896.1 OmpA family protein [Bacteroidales bacterium]